MLPAWTSAAARMFNSPVFDLEMFDLETFDLETFDSGFC